MSPVAPVHMLAKRASKRSVHYSYCPSGIRRRLLLERLSSGMAFGGSPVAFLLLDRIAVHGKLDQLFQGPELSHLVDALNSVRMEVQDAQLRKAE